MFYIEQIKKKDCGFVALKILLANIYKKRDFLFIPYPKKSDETYTFLELEKEANKYGVNISCFAVEEKEELRENKELPILLTISDTNSTHAIVVYKISKNFVYYLDPAVGEVKTQIDDFIEMWDGKGIKVENKKDKLSYTYKSKIGLNIKEKISLMSMQIISSLSFIIGTFFIDKNSYFFIPIILFSLFAILEIIIRRYSIYLCKELDDRIYPHLMEIKKDKFPIYFKEVEFYKKDIISFHSGIIFQLISALFIGAIFILNNRVNIFYILIALLIAICEIYIIEPYLKEKRNKIAQEEKKLFSYKEIHKEQLDIIHDQGYKYGYIQICIKYAFLAIALIGTIIIMSVSKIVSLSYLLFYFIASYLLYKNFYLLLSYENKERSISKREVIINEMKIND